MKLHIMVMSLFCILQTLSMSPEAMLAHMAHEEKKENPLEPLMYKRTVADFKETGITKWNMVNPNDGNTLLHYWARCHTWSPALGPIFLKQIDANSLNNKGKTPLLLLIEQSPCYSASGNEQEDKKGIENLAAKFHHLIQAGALLAGRAVMDNDGKTPIKRLNQLIAMGSKYPVVLKLQALVLAHLKQTGQQDLLEKIPEKKAAL